MSQPRWTRRNFLAAGASAALAVPTLISAKALGSPSQPGASDRLRVGLIGPGYRARDLLNESPAELDFVALADCDLRQMEAFSKWAAEALPGRLAPTCQRYQDYHEMFDKEKLDAVVIATTTHARALNLSPRHAGRTGRVRRETIDFDH